MLLIFLGSPGSGKGTLSSILVNEYNYYHISTGDIFRKIISEKNSDLSKELKSVLKSGRLVEDDLTIKVLENELKLINFNKNSNVIFDGFPRNIIQAEKFKEILIKKSIKIDKVFNLLIPQSVVIDRISKRLICSKCLKVYHKQNLKPKIEWKCDNDGTELITREDDKLENVINRLKVYDDQTYPLIEFYNKEKILFNIKANSNLKEIFFDIKKILNLK